MRSRSDLGLFLNKRGLIGRGLELSVARGDFSRQILDHWRGERLYLVDCWRPQPPFDYQDAHNVSAEQHDANSRQVESNLAAHCGRYEISRASSREAAERFSDGSLDFVYIDANHKYPAIAEDLRLWWPKVKEGGLFSGAAYLDAVIDGTVFGVKSAVDEFAAAHRLQIRLTYDKFPTWFVLKPPADRSLSSRNIGILTAYEGRAAELAQWSVPNKQRYCQRHGYQLICRTAGFDASRPASWSKIKFLREHLGEFDWLFWTDVDSLIMNPGVRLEEFIDGEYDIVITMEDFGIGVYNLNAGQLFVRNTEWSRGFLSEVYSQAQFVNDRLWENRAIIHLWEKSDLSAHIQVVMQRRFNSYLANFRRDDFLLHFPEIPHDQRKNLMQLHDQFSLG